MSECKGRYGFGCAGVLLSYLGSQDRCYSKPMRYELATGSGPGSNYANLYNTYFKEVLLSQHFFRMG